MIQLLNRLIGYDQICSVKAEISVGVCHHGIVGADAKHAIAGSLNVECKLLAWRRLVGHNEVMASLVGYIYKEQ